MSWRTCNAIINGSTGRDLNSCHTTLQKRKSPPNRGQMHHPVRAQALRLFRRCGRGSRLAESGGAAQWLFYFRPHSGRRGKMESAHGVATIADCVATQAAGRALQNARPPEHPLVASSAAPWLRPSPTTRRRLLDTRCACGLRFTLLSTLHCSLMLKKLRRNECLTSFLVHFLCP